MCAMMTLRSWISQQFGCVCFSNFSDKFYFHFLSAEIAQYDIVSVVCCVLSVGSVCVCVCARFDLIKFNVLMAVDKAPLNL